ncbi:PBP1A family penicillin-binding protein [Rhodovarius crocodyli]|uniref:Penicillin-binding protein 1A n=2 Tax=Rhodovarius crocodyli TaxID=1979269 RepID=A0A437MDV5_9PROT|nr:PBP1A family penicillin-binding protein [Rhodovarius crocodyli]
MATPSHDPAAPAPKPEKQEKPRKGRKRARGWGILRLMTVGATVMVLSGGVAGLGMYASLQADLPDHRWLADYHPQQMSRIYAADSRLMAELAVERRVFVPIEAIPARLQRAFISAEDQRFREHHGIDPMGIVRSLVTYARERGSGRRMQGASTITQQVAKNMLVGSDRTLLRKAREALLAIRLENTLSKDRILEIYLNEIYLGAQAYGVAAAAQAYFNKGLDDLTIAEMAFLASLPKAPNNYNPARFADAARARRNWVLERMAEDGAITQEEMRAAQAEPLVTRPTRRPDMVAVGQHFTEEVRRELVTRFGAEQTGGGGLVVRTSLDPDLQAATETALHTGLMNYDRRRGGWRGPAARIAAGPQDWQPGLEATPRPGGMLASWQLAVVRQVSNTEARVSWLERSPARTLIPREGVMDLSDLAWARPQLPGRPNETPRLGNAPRRMGDVVSVGDVVMVEPNAQRQGRVSLRQVPEVEGAVVALDPATGRILAMAGGWSFDRSQYNRATQALRQPGSSFKPFVYLAALEEGIPPNQRFLDTPVEVQTGAGVWRPSNYSGGATGSAVSMRAALERSLNLVTVRIAQQVGMERVADVANRFGVIENMQPYLAMSLGAGETTVARMAAAYAGFVNGGRRVNPTLVDSVQDQRGRVVWRGDTRGCQGCSAGPEQVPSLEDNRRRITDPIAAYQMVNMLQGVVQRGTGGRAGAGLNRPVAGKTGTSNDYKDNWFVGFTPDIVVAVWVGFDDPRSLGNGEAGGSNAAPIFRDVMAAALQGSPAVPFRAPPGVSLVRIQHDNGQSIIEAFRPGTENSAQPVDSFSPGAAERVEQNLGGIY